MHAAQLPPNETKRLEALHRYEMLDTEPEPSFDDLAALAAHVCGTPAAMVSLVDERRQWFKARVGIDLAETCREHAFCAHAILTPDPLIVPDASKDARFHDNPLVTAAPGIRFYAGVPLVTPESVALGTLCVVDVAPRSLSQRETDALAALARQVVALIQTRRLHSALNEQNQKLSEEVSLRRKSEHALKLRSHELEIAQREAAEAVQSRTRFLANVSHEIRTPLNGVVGMTDLLLGTTLTNEQVEYCKTLRFSTEGLLSVVNDILDFSNLGADRLVLTSTEFDLAETVDDALNLVSDAARSKELRINAFVDWDLPDKVEGDRLRLRQILVNVVGNAVKFTADGEVRVNVTLGEERDGRTRIHFKVRGIGEHQRPRIFQAFSQVDESSSRRFGGTGLGLAISQRLVEKMEGEIGFESEPGRGSAFWFYVWLRSRPESVRRPALKSVSAGKRVLVVSRSAVLSSVTEYLRGLGFETVTHTSADKDDLPAGEFDLVAVEYQRPRSEDAELLQLVAGRAAARRIPVLYVPSGSRVAGSPSPRPGDAVIEEPVRRSSLLSFLTSTFEPQRAKDKKTATSPLRTADPLRILVVEDNAVNQKVISNMLRKLGHVFDLAEDGALAVEAAAKKAYDVILMDCQMPRMDGYEATKTIRREPGPCRDASIVALTASAMAEDREKCLSIGMNDYLAKPVTMDVLVAALERCRHGEHEAPIARGGRG